MMADSVEIENHLDPLFGLGATVIAKGRTDRETARSFLGQPAFIVAGKPPEVTPLHPKVARVIVNGPATVVFWDDGEKTVVKCRECERCRFAKDADAEVDGPVDPVVRALATAFGKLSCQARFDPEKAVMAAMLKRLYRNWQDVVRREFPEGDGDE
ncbi:MAG: hypothetical protein IJ781_03995 [Atopobiaceae bacterium]|nr:hypothetical protein [Atopobiaceae bacterium]